MTLDSKYTSKTPPPVRPPRKNSPSMWLKHGKNSIALAQGEPLRTLELKEKSIDDRNEPRNSKSGLFDEVGRRSISF